MPFRVVICGCLSHHDRIDRSSDKYSLVSGQPPRLPQGPRALVFRQVLPGAEGLLRVLREVAAARGKTASQVAINWCMCKGTVPIPGAKSLTQVGCHTRCLV